MAPEAHSQTEIVGRVAQLARTMRGAELDPGLVITADTDIIRELKLDSLAAMDFIMALESEFDALIPVDSMVEIRTVGDLATLLRTQASQRLAAEHPAAERHPA